MMKWRTKICLTVMLGILLLVFPAIAAINTISQGNTVFLGEDGLDISSFARSGTTFGYWESGASIATSSPYDTYVVSDPTKFYVDPSKFGSEQGSWYLLDSSGKANGVAVVVAEPKLNLRVEDKTVDVDVSVNKWVYRGDEVGFQIDTNLYTITQRGTPARITIKVQPPGGGGYTALVNDAGTHSIENIQVSTSPFDTGALWDTGNSLYTPGTYTIWAECNVNHMKDNYGVMGKTESTKTSLANQERNPLIEVSVPTTSPIIQVTLTPTTVITTIPKTSQTTAVLTGTPTPAATTIPATIPPTSATPVGTTQKKSPGFGIVVTAIAVTFIAALALKKQP